MVFILREMSVDTAWAQWGSPPWSAQIRFPAASEHCKHSGWTGHFSRGPLKVALPKRKAGLGMTLRHKPQGSVQGLEKPSGPSAQGPCLLWWQLLSITLPCGTRGLWSSWPSWQGWGNMGKLRPGEE